MRILIGLCSFLLLCAPPLPAKIDLSKIAQIESGNNSLAWNEKSGATGLYQITSICLEHYNHSHTTKYEIDQMFDPYLSLIVADWYFEWLSSQTHNDEDSLIAYNWGIGHWRRWKSLGRNKKALPKETREYLVKYYKLV